MGRLSDNATIEAVLCVSAATAVEIAKRLRMAEKYLRELKGDAWYDALMAQQLEEPEAADVVDAAEAESLVAFYYALPHLNLRIDEGGGILLQEWTDDGSGGRLQKAFATLSTLRAVRAELLSQAKALVYDGPVVEYEDEEETIVAGVRDVAPTGGFAMSAVPCE